MHTFILHLQGPVSQRNSESLPEDVRESKSFKMVNSDYRSMTCPCRTPTWDCPTDQRLHSMYAVSIRHGDNRLYDSVIYSSEYGGSTGSLQIGSDVRRPRMTAMQLDISTYKDVYLHRSRLQTAATNALSVDSAQRDLERQCSLVADVAM